MRTWSDSAELSQQLAMLAPLQPSLGIITRVKGERRRHLGHLVYCGCAAPARTESLRIEVVTVPTPSVGALLENM